MSQIQLLEYQDTWPAQFEGVAKELRPAFSAGSLTVEHIGSTAVPGLCAKPVLDLMVGLDSLQEAEDSREALASLGFDYRAEYEVQLPGRRYFVRAAGQTPRIHLHCLVLEGALWQQHLRFRNVLRQQTEVMHEYAALKRRLALLYAENKSAYTEAKAPFIQRILSDARAAN